MTKRWGVLISGNGSNLQALMEELRVTVVIAASTKAYGILRARRQGIPVEVASPELLKKENKAQLEKWIFETLERYQVDHVFLAGYMKIVSAELIRKITARGIMLNIHPSLLPKHKGLNAFEKAIEAGDREFGVTVHHVVEELDSGSHHVQRKFTGQEKLWLHINEQAALRLAVRKYK